MRVIDLFCGCGGLSLGFLADGWTVTRAVDVDASIAETYRKNHPEVDVLVADIRDVDHGGVFSPGDGDVIIGGPPCQGFSMAGARIREGFISDPRNYLFRHYYNVVKTVGPRAFVMENVKGILTMEGGAIFREILRLFSEEMGERSYRMYHRVVRAADFGIPQKRERVILIGSALPAEQVDALWEQTREGIQREIPTYFDRVTVWDAISNLPRPTADGQIPNPRPDTAYQAYLACPNPILTNHIQTKHSPLAVARMHRVGGGENFTALEETIRSVHSGSYGRLLWDDLAPTITTRFDTPAGGRFIHPEEDRTLTPREAARIQSFPDSFVFYGSKTSICKQIGNAVPPKISYFLARLVRHLTEEEGAK